MAPPFDNVRIILVRTGKPGNIGAVARAMANTRLSDLWLVEPRCDPLSHESKRQSTRGEPILHAARVVGHLTDALHEVTFTAGTSCRGGVYRGQIEMPPRRLGSELSRLGSAGKAAIVFGPEDCGLRDDEVLACDAIVRIPSNPDYPSLNLAQAVMVCLYEFYLAATTTDATAADTIPAAQARGESSSTPHGSATDRGGFLGAGAPVPADAATLRRLMTALEAALLRIGYLRPEHPQHLLFPIRAILGRAGLSQTEAQILIGLAQQILDFARKKGVGKILRDTDRAKPGE